MITRSSAVAVFFLFAATAAAASAAQSRSSGFMDAQLLGGQLLYRGAASSFGGLADLAAGLALSPSERWSWYGTYNGSYRGFKDVNDLVGGGTLFQQSMDHRISLKVERKLSDTWALKPSLSYTKGFFRETQDERWGRGLYDYNRIGAGLVSDWSLSSSGSPVSLSAGYHVFHTAYPNYESLPSKFGAELASAGVTVDNDPGRKTLDTLSHQINGDASMEFSSSLTAWGSYNLNLRFFPEQKVIDAEARYLSEKRLDVANSLDLGVSWKPDEDWDVPLTRQRFKTVLGLGYKFEWLRSNQNHFDTDPSINAFVPRFYDYIENTVSPSIQTVLASGQRLSLSYDFEIKNYLGRAAQDATGQFLGRKLVQTAHALSLNGSYPVARGFSLKLAGTWKLSRANTSYERSYSYNYGAARYFAGIGYAF